MFELGAACGRLFFWSDNAIPLGGEFDTMRLMVGGAMSKRRINKLRAGVMTYGAGFGRATRRAFSVPWEDLAQAERCDLTELCICGHQKNWRYSSRHDSFYCKLCNVWFKSACGCTDYCLDRPELPISNKGVGPDKRRDVPKAQFQDDITFGVRTTGIANMRILLKSKLRGQQPYLTVLVKNNNDEKWRRIEVSIADEPIALNASVEEESTSFKELYSWIVLNKTLLLRFWNNFAGEEWLCSSEFLEQLQMLDYSAEKATECQAAYLREGWMDTAGFIDGLQKVT